jgi:3-hydroxyisobutyrate dehydrogenase-like beta-hydroxyacid dehydrogenase
MQEVSILGLGAMGITIAELFIQQGARVTVWNRSRAKADPLIARGAVVATDAAAAVRASPVSVMCVSNHAAVQSILDAPGVAAAFTGRTLIQFTTISPGEARDTHAWAQRHGGQLLAGAIQAAPSQMGKPDTPILISGGEPVFQASRPLLEVLAGQLTYLGPAPDAAATMDLATLSYVYGATVGFLHGALIAEAEGFDVAAYGTIVRGIAPSFGAFFEHEARVIRSGDFTISESPLRISVDATARLLETARASGISTELPAFVADLLARADAAGLGGEEVAALIKVLRGPASSSAASATAERIARG